MRLVLLHIRERRPLVAAGGRELALAPGQPVAHCALLRGTGGDFPGGRGDLLADLAGRVPDFLHLLLRTLDRVRNLLVLASDLVQEVELVEQLREAGRLEHDVERGRGLGRVDLDDALVQPFRRGLVLALQEHELAGLQLVELVQPVELALMQREHFLELIEAHGRAVDVVLEPVDLVGDDLDLRGEDALALARHLDLLLEYVDPSVDHLLALRDTFLAEGRCYEQEAGERDANEYRAGERAGSETGAHPSKSFVKGSAVPAGDRRQV